MANATLNQLLQEWCDWLFRQGADNAASDVMQGADVTRHNANRNPWFIPGTWGQVNVPKRRIRIKEGTQLFVVAASSHATFKELALAGVAQTEENLKTHLRSIDDAWFSKILATGTVNGDLTKEELDEAETKMFDVDINGQNPYLGLTHTSSGKTKMMSKGYVKRLTLPVGKTRLVIAAQSPAKRIGNRTESQYDVHVEYEVEVT
jgi:hypothetical protein